MGFEPGTHDLQPRRPDHSAIVTHTGFGVELATYLKLYTTSLQAYSRIKHFGLGGCDLARGDEILLRCKA